MEKVPVNKRIHFRLVFVVIIIVSFATLSVGAFSLWEFYSTLKMQSIEDATTLSMTIADQLENYLQDKVTHITEVGEQISMHPEAIQQGEELQKHLYYLHDFQDVFIVTPTKTMVIKGIAEKLDLKNLTFQKINKPVLIEDTNEFSSRVLVKVIIPLGPTPNFLVGTMDLEQSNYITDLIRDVKMGKQGYVCVLNSQGIHKILSVGNRVILHKTSPEILRQLHLGQAGFSEVEEGNQKLLIAYAPVKSLNWGVVAHIPKDQVYQKLKDLAVYLFFIFLFVIILAIIISVGIAYSLTKPIQKVILGAQEISKGNYNQISFETDRNDEVGILARAMNKMVQEISLNHAGLTNKINQLSVISDLTKVINSSLNLEDVLNSIVEMTRLVFDYHSCALFLSGREGSLKLMTTCQFTSPEEFIEDIPVWTYSNGEPLVINDLNCNDWRVKLPFPEIINSVAFIPLQNHGKIKGLMIVSHTQANIFSQEAVEILMTLGGKAALAIENALLYETELQNQAQIQQAEKFAVIGELAAGTAHEIRNPLTAIRGFIQLLQNKYRGMEPESEYTDLILKEIDRINYITKEFLKLAKPSLPQFGIHDLNQVLREVTLLLQSEGRLKDVEINFDADSKLPPMNIDQAQLKQVFMNLGTNAIHALATKGTLSIRTQFAAAEAKARIFFNDNGIGIAEEELAKIFDPFFTSRAEGTGLGLAVSYRLIKNHGGEINVTSILGKGTEFVIEIPVL